MIIVPTVIITIAIMITLSEINYDYSKVFISAGTGPANLADLYQDSFHRRYKTTEINWRVPLLPN